MVAFSSLTDSDFADYTKKALRLEWLDLDWTVMQDKRKKKRWSTRMPISFNRTSSLFNLNCNLSLFKNPLRLYLIGISQGNIPGIWYIYLSGISLRYPWDISVLVYPREIPQGYGIYISVGYPWDIPGISQWWYIPGKYPWDIPRATEIYIPPLGYLSGTKVQW